MDEPPKVFAFISRLARMPFFSTRRQQTLEARKVRRKQSLRQLQCGHTSGSVTAQRLFFERVGWQRWRPLGFADET
jgi:hypothetical protein